MSLIHYWEDPNPRPPPFSIQLFTPELLAESAHRDLVVTYSGGWYPSSPN